MLDISADGERKNPLTREEVLTRRNNPRLLAKEYNDRIKEAEKAKEIKDLLRPFFVRSRQEVLEDLADTSKDLMETRAKYRILMDLEAYMDKLIEKGKLYQFKLNKAIQAIEAQKENGGR